ncbi:uncharacterized protein PV06_00265 [Exophiala oligosperma]|uniref:Uncharacterized protein n=1 Tax=Exophiala oligosperma TaxID=215243 RepID=A0A0D2CCF1_9EURO|nr:uncharacterized protein PV06_00265 [Exophiala oligosperma]KIW47577.1 hypothetical protein PV06_00265 [Exophiala oligosperma]
MRTAPRARRTQMRRSRFTLCPRKHRGIDTHRKLRPRPERVRVGVTPVHYRFISPLPEYEYNIECGGQQNQILTRLTVIDAPYPRKKGPSFERCFMFLPHCTRVETTTPTT